MKVITVIIAIATLFQGAVSDIDLSYLDEKIDPCDDFYDFACGNFAKHHKPTKNEPSLDLFSMTEDELTEVGQNILSSPIQSYDSVALKKAKTAYKSCVENPKKTSGASSVYYPKPEMQVIKEYGGMPLVDNIPVDKISLVQIANISATFGLHHLFQFMVRNFDPDSYLLIMYADNFEMPEMIKPRSKSYDEILEESFKRKRIDRSRLLGQEDPLDVLFWEVAHYLNELSYQKKSKLELVNELNQMKEFMTKLFDGGIVDDNMISLDNVVTLRQLQNWTNHQFGEALDINWVEYFRTHFKNSKFNITEEFEIFCIDPEFVYGTLNLIRQTDPSVVKNFILFRTFLYMAPDSNSELNKAFRRYTKALGLPYYEREEYCARKILDVVDSVSLSFAVTQDFVNYYYDINKISEAVGVIQNTKKSFQDALSNFDWLDAESRDAVYKKLENIVVFLGFPDFVENTKKLDHFYENVQICSTDNYGNARRIRAFKQAYDFSEYVDHEAWTTSPFEVNAYAVRASQRIMAPLAIIQSSFFNGSDSLFDYSRFGTIIGHEFIHHFDTVGVTYNETGYGSPLLSPSSDEAFAAKSQCFIDQYGSYYVPEVDLYLNGTVTVNENMADIGGLNHALAAFRKIQKEGLKKQKPDEKYTDEQKFFINFATTYCAIYSEDYLRKLVSSNDHSPARYRVIGTLSNSKDFSEAFKCPVGSKMNPQNKCNIW